MSRGTRVAPLSSPRPSQRLKHIPVLSVPVKEGPGRSNPCDSLWLLCCERLARIDDPSPESEAG